MILCASSTSIPSRFRITVELSRSVSAISLGIFHRGWLDHTYFNILGLPWDLRLLLIGVILEDGAVVTNRFCLPVSVCFAGAALVAAAAFTGLFGRCIYQNPRIRQIHHLMNLLLCKLLKELLLGTCFL